MSSIFEESILHHVSIVLILLWLLSSFNCCPTVAYFISLAYLYLVHERYVTRLRSKLRFEERRNSNQRRVLCDSETVRWLNYAVEKIWLICMEPIVSQKILLPIMPWFLEKYKPWTVKEAVVRHLYMGRSPPMFTEMRVLPQSTGDDHLVMELGMIFRTADDMNAILAVKLTKRLGFGMRAKLHLTGMHVEGKVKVGVKFLRNWPFLGRLRVCFVQPPYFQMTVKPIISHGLDVTELPGIAGWLDNLLAMAFEQSLVEPNMLVVDMEKFVSPQPETWFSVDEKEPVGFALLEVIEAADMKPSDLNGLADPYVKVQLGPFRFRSKIQRKTLAPKWHEECKVPIFSWESPNVLTIEVHDKDHFIDDALGDCSITIGELRDGQRHDMWLPLQNIKMGRLHLAITIVEGNSKAPDLSRDIEISDDYNEKNSTANEISEKGSLLSGMPEKSPKVADKFEPIDIEGQEETGIWVHHPGGEVSQVWEPRKGKSKLLDAPIRVEGGDSFKSTASAGSYNNESSSSDESQEGNKERKRNRVQRGLNKIGSLFHRNSKKDIKIEDPVPSPPANLKTVDEDEIGVKLIVDNKDLSVPSPVQNSKAESKESPEGSGQESPSSRNVKDMAKSVLQQAGKSARGIKHTFSRKGFKKEGDISVGSESSDESLPSSARIEGIIKSEESNDQVAPRNHAMEIEDPMNKVCLEEKIGDEPSTSSKEYEDLLVKESSNPKPSDENSEIGEK